MYLQPRILKVRDALLNLGIKVFSEKYNLNFAELKCLISNKEYILLFFFDKSSDLSKKIISIQKDNIEKNINSLIFVDILDDWTSAFLFDYYTEPLNIYTIDFKHEEIYFDGFKINKEGCEYLSYDDFFVNLQSQNYQTLNQRIDVMGQNHQLRNAFFKKTFYPILFATFLATYLLLKYQITIIPNTYNFLSYVSPAIKFLTLNPETSYFASTFSITTLIFLFLCIKYYLTFRSFITPIVAHPDNYSYAKKMRLGMFLLSLMFLCATHLTHWPEHTALIFLIYQSFGFIFLIVSGYLNVTYPYYIRVQKSKLNDYHKF
jgi:hypothetical protein